MRKRKQKFCTKYLKNTPKEIKDRAEELNRLANEKFKNPAKSLSVRVKEKEEEIRKIAIRLERLLDGYLEQYIEKEVYRKEKAKLLSKKKSLQAEIHSLSHARNDWLEPFRGWVKTVQTLDKIAVCNDLFAKKVVAKETFGSNLTLHNKTLRPAGVQAGESPQKERQNG